MVLKAVSTGGTKLLALMRSLWLFGRRAKYRVGVSSAHTGRAGAVDYLEYFGFGVEDEGPLSKILEAARVWAGGEALEVGWRAIAGSFGGCVIDFFSGFEDIVDPEGFVETLAARVVLAAVKMVRKRRSTRPYCVDEFGQW